MGRILRLRPFLLSSNNTAIADLIQLQRRQNFLNGDVDKTLRFQVYS